MTGSCYWSVRAAGRAIIEIGRANALTGRRQKWLQVPPAHVRLVRASAPWTHVPRYRLRATRSRTLTDDTREKKLGEAVFKKEERATEGAKAMSEYKAAVEAERAKTERLRALRLAREAAGKNKK